MEVKFEDNAFSTAEIIEEASKKMSFEKGDILLHGSVSQSNEEPEIVLK